MKGLSNHIQVRMLPKVICLMMVFGAFITQSCHQEKVSINNIRVENSHVDDNKNRFILKAAIKAKKADVFEFYYVLDSLNEKFNEDKKIRKKVYGGDVLEEIQFELENEKPLKFMLVFGRNHNQKTLEIDSIEVQYKTKRLVIDGHLVKYFFNKNEYLEFAETGNTLTFEREVNVPPPYMTSSALLNKKMKIEFR